MKVPALVLLCGATLAAQAPTVTKVEPPNWWTSSSANPVRVLLRGTNLRNARVTGLSAANIAISERGTYLFADLTIPATAGDYNLTVQTAAGEATAPFRVDAPLSPNNRWQGFNSDDVIYLVMPDRFSNGDPANDDPEISRGLFDLKKPRFYHGGDFKGIQNHLPYLKSLGITALWMTPVYDNNNRPDTKEVYGGQPTTGYHGYGAVDYYGVEEHFGTMAELRSLIDAAHALGIKVIQDQVANHTGPYHPWVSDPPTPTWFHGTQANHINETWQTWSIPDIHSDPAVRRGVLDGWFANILPDMNQDDPEVARYEIQNTLWWLGTAGFDAIRQDTLTYVPTSFWSQWSAAIKREFPRVNVVGEVLDADPVLTSYFQGIVDTVFDFPSYFKARDAFAGGKPLRDLIQSLAHDRLYPQPGMLVTLTGLHDAPRFMSSGGTADGLKLAFTWLLTTRGVPMIYYGDEIGMEGGEDPDNRRDFPASAFENSTPLANFVRKLTVLRARLEPLRRGPQFTLAASDQTWLYQRGIGQQIVFIAINNGATAATFDLPPGQLQPQLGAGKLTGATLHLPARSAEIVVSGLAPSIEMP